MRVRIEVTLEKEGVEPVVATSNVVFRQGATRLLVDEAADAEVRALMRICWRRLGMPAVESVEEVAR